MRVEPVQCPRPRLVAAGLEGEADDVGRHGRRSRGVAQLLDLRFADVVALGAVETEPRAAQVARHLDQRGQSIRQRLDDPAARDRHRRADGPRRRDDQGDRAAEFEADYADPVRVHRVLGQPGEGDVGGGQHGLAGQLAHLVSGDLVVDLVRSALIQVRDHDEPTLGGQARDHGEHRVGDATRLVQDHEPTAGDAVGLSEGQAQLSAVVQPEILGTGLGHVSTKPRVGVSSST